MKSYDSSVNLSDSELIFEIYSRNKITVKPVYVSNRNFVFLDAFNNKINPSIFKNIDCIYTYCLMGNPVYVGSSINFYKNRLAKQLPALYVNKFSNMKSPSKGYNRKNARERFIYDIHEMNINIDALTLDIFCLHKNFLGEDYNPILKISDTNSIAYIEQAIINKFIFNGETLLNRVPALNHRTINMDVNSGSAFSRDIMVNNHPPSLVKLFETT